MRVAPKLGILATREGRASLLTPPFGRPGSFPRVVVRTLVMVAPGFPDPRRAVVRKA